MSFLIVYGQPMPKGSKTRLANGAMMEAAPGRSRCKAHAKHDPTCEPCRVAKQRRKEQRAKIVGWPAAIESAARKFRDDFAWAGTETLSGPVNLCARFFMPHPKNGKQRDWHTGKPDLSKLIRNVEDAMTQAGVWRDDSQVVSFDGSEKKYALKGAPIGSEHGPRVEITVNVR